MNLLQRTVAVLALAGASLAHAQVTLSNLPGTGSGAGTNLGIGVDDINRWKAVGITVGSQPLKPCTITALVSNPEPASQLFAGIFTDSGGDPGALIALSNVPTIPANIAPTEVTIDLFTPGIILAPNTTYWFVLAGPGTTNSLLWESLTPNTPPTASPGAAFAGYRFSADEGDTWSESTIFNGVTVELAAPAIGNLPGTGSGSGSNLGLGISGTDRTKAVGFTTGAQALERFCVTALISNASPASTLSGGIYLDSAGAPGALFAPFNDVGIPDSITATEVTLIPQNFFDIVLEPNTSYWVVLDGPDTAQSLLWEALTPSTPPTAAPGITFDGYAFSSNGGATWGPSGIFNGISLFACIHRCPADLDGDGDNNIDDIETFVDDFLAGLPTADIDRDGDTDVDDIDAFVTVFLEGCE